MNQNSTSTGDKEEEIDGRSLCSRKWSALLKRCEGVKGLFQDESDLSLIATYLSNTETKAEEEGSQGDISGASESGKQPSSKSSDNNESSDFNDKEMSYFSRCRQALALIPPEMRADKLTPKKDANKWWKDEDRKVALHPPSSSGIPINPERPVISSVNDRKLQPASKSSLADKLRRQAKGSSLRKKYSAALSVHKQNMKKRISNKREGLLKGVKKNRHFELLLEFRKLTLNKVK